MLGSYWGDQADDATKELGQLRAKLASLTEKLGLEGESDEQLIAALSDWRREIRNRQASLEDEMAKWSKLNQLLGDGGLAGLEKEASTSAEAAAGLMEGLSEAEIQRARNLTEEDARSIEAKLDRASQAYNVQFGRVGEMAKMQIGVAEAEEEESAARVELERLVKFE